MLHISRKSAVGALTAGALLIGGGVLAWRPAIAGELAAGIDAVVTCSTTTFCVGWQNNSTGVAVQGTGTKSDGIRGYTSATGKSGIYGETDASSGGYGVHGANAASGGIAVFGAGQSGTGVSASAKGSKPALASSNTGSGDGADLFSTSGIGAVIGDGSNSANGVTRALGEGGHPGSVIGGNTIGAIITAGKDGTPLIVTGTSESGSGEVTIDSTGNINTTGDIIYAGSLIADVATRAGVAVTAYAPQATQATIEDSGTAQLVGGAAVVRLDAVYAAAIDMRTPYRVFLTPNADSHGLYVAQKTATAFVVREMQGGKGTYAFDYRILGNSARNPTARMAVIGPAAQARLFSH